jgi:hypothetical protein
VKQNSSLFPLTAGYHNQLDKEVHLGIPYSREDNSLAPSVDGQFVFNYNDNIMGWSINTNYPANCWEQVNNRYFFGGFDGRVFAVRTENGSTKYADFNEPINFLLQTRFLTTEEVVAFKFYRNIIVQIGQSDSSSLDIKYAWDYLKDYADLSLILTNSSKFGTAEYGRGTYGANKHLSPVRRTLSPSRVAQVSFLLSESTLDKPFELFGVYVEGQLGNTRSIGQKGSVR